MPSLQDNGAEQKNRGFEHMKKGVQSVLFSVLVYELIGPSLTKRSLLAAGEIKPEGKTSAREENKPVKPITLK